MVHVEKFFFRLTPPLATTILFTTFLMRYIGSGPKWNSVSTFEDPCKKYWWSALLYVQNYANVDLNTVSIDINLEKLMSVFKSGYMIINNH